MSATIQGYVTDHEKPIGHRLTVIRNIITEAQDAERQLLMQLGVDFAKHLTAIGIEPTGQPVAETLKAIEAEPHP